MSIVCTPRDYTKHLNKDIQKLLDDISDFVFTTPDGQVFKMSDINKNVPIYLDLKETRIEEHEITWQELCDRLDSLEKEYTHLKEMSYDECDAEDSQRRCFLSDMVPIIKHIKEKYLKDHPNPSPNDIVPISQKITVNGYYTRNGKSHNPEIVLLMETLGNERWNDDDVAFTLVHEMFHAFYDCDLSKADKSLPYVEEPLTEYAMLKFMEALAKNDPKYNDLLDKAQRNVQNKQFSLGMAHYGFGYYLWKYENESGMTLNNILWIDEFRKAKYSISDSTPEYKEYAIPFRQGFYAFIDEFHQMELLRVILLNANGAQLPLPQKNPLPRGIRWKKCGLNAYYAVSGDTLYLDGAFLENSELFPFDRHVIHDKLFRSIHRGIHKIVLWDHFICDDFWCFKHYLFYSDHIRVEFSSRNFYYSEINGAIYDATKTALLCCPKDATNFQIPDGVKLISRSAFDDCRVLQHVHIPASVEEIPDGAFSHCEALENEIVFKQRLLYVPETATEYVIPNEVKEIGSRAFDDCRSLQHVHIPASVKKISDGAFSDCESLEDEIVFEQRLLCVPRTATEYVIPNNVKEIGTCAFDGCKVLKKVTIPGSVKEIPYHTFSDCKNLESVTINEGLEKIGNGAFRGCRLTDVTLPASLKEIDSWAFFECPMQTLTFKGANPPETDEPFETEYLRATCTIRVPAGSKSGYAKIFPDHTIAEY